MKKMKKLAMLVLCLGLVGATSACDMDTLTSMIGGLGGESQTEEMTSESLSSESEEESNQPSQSDEGEKPDGGEIVKVGTEVGNLCPDFTVDIIKATDGVFAFAEEDYTLSEHSGKVRIINFWATWCSACKHEFPYFNDFAVAYPEVEVVAICGASGSQAIVQKWMNDEKEDAQAKGWTNFDFIFGYYDDAARELYTDLGGTGFWPMTIIVDEDGIIRYSAEVEMDFEKLEAAVLPLLND